MTARGALVDRSTQAWVKGTGRRVRLAEHPWLDGPVGEPDRIGADYFHRLAEARGLEVREGPGLGLMPDFGALAGPRFDPARVDPAVAAFYERSADYELELWSEWTPLYRPFGGAVVGIFSRRLGQLNMPLSPLEASRGVRSRVLQLRDPATGHVPFTGWVREVRGSGRVLYVGAYGLTEVPGHDGPCIKVVFPLPNGNATVVLRPVAEPDGALRLESAGWRFGDPGFYFVVRRDEGSLSARYVASFKETLRVYRDEAGALRTDHDFRLWGARALSLHYRIRPLAAA